MLTIISFTLILAAVILLLVQKIQVRFCLSDNFSVELDYSFVTLKIKKARNKPEQKTTDSHNQKNRRKFIPSTIATFRALRFILPRSRVTLNTLSLELENNTPDRIFYHTGIANSLIYYFITFVPVAAKDFRILNDSINIDSGNNTEHSPSLDISFEASLFNFFSTVIIFIFLKGRRKVTGKNV